MKYITTVVLLYLLIFTLVYAYVEQQKLTQKKDISLECNKMNPKKKSLSTLELTQLLPTYRRVV